MWYIFLYLFYISLSVSLYVDIHFYIPIHHNHKDWMWDISHCIHIDLQKIMYSISLSSTQFEIKSGLHGSISNCGQLFRPLGALQHSAAMQCIQHCATDLPDQLHCADEPKWIP